MIATGLILTSLFTLGLSKPVARTLRLHEARSTVPTGFSQVGSADADTVLNLRLGLVSSSADKLVETLYDVSTPSSANYGQHLSRSEAAALLAPSFETLQAVNAWLDENDITASTISPGGDWLSISIPVSQANEMLDADFSVFTHEATGAQSVRTLQYSIPTDLVGHLQLVHPTTTFTQPTSPRFPLNAKLYSGSKEQKRQSACGSDVDPACLQELYGIPTTAATNPDPIVVTGYDNQYPDPSDMSNFLSKYRTDINSSTTWTIVELDGGSYDPTNPGDEADLDVQYTVGLATGVPVYFISVGESTSDGVFGFLDTANYVLSNLSDAYVMTTSYGSNENEISADVFSKLCDAYASLGTAGISVLFASGDGGVSGSQSSSCTDFVPTFPSGCPYVTSVGATTGTSPETAADFSSGGFSNVYPTPSFQSSDVSAFISGLGTTYSGLYNASGRGFPDVSTQGENFLIGYDGDIYTVDGTSCSSPTFASVVALLNDELLSAGKSRLGWLNPWLYENADAFNDVTSGDNPGCSTNGFTATTGWDPVTGLGTPNYSALKTAAGL
ncbi:family S53 protease-like protein [Fomitopsis serialis]|uniref:family S53 protease-like protein n=1 Tax=Fomitopsis serialis TaxID=139415 RepID=UPI0020079852|nr:family S53 protease-like protein [Neoantrodia serialis]KAH9921038.1 family S53 protease-like protein [Neoantrodia serialis]